MNSRVPITKVFNPAIILSIVFASLAGSAFAQTTPPAPAPAPPPTAAPVTVTPLAPTNPGDTTETIVTTKKNPDGSTSTVITTRVIPGDSAPAAAPDDSDLSGLKHRWASSYGTYYGRGGNGVTQNGLSIKTDYFFYRTTGQEALFSLDSSAISTKLVGGIGDDVFEYRLRFGGSSRAYAGLSLGIGSSAEFASANLGLASGAAVGYEFPSRTFVELRYMANNVGNVGATQLMIGSRY